jgi:hypothetical protein
MAYATRRAQVAIEFLVLASFVLIVFMLVGGIAAQRAGVLSVERVFATYEEFGGLLELEIQLAQRAAPGYVREFDCFSNITAGRTYTVELRKGPGGSNILIVADDPKIAPVFIKVPSNLNLVSATVDHSTIRRLGDLIELELCVRGADVTTTLIRPQCGNGIDDDGDGLADYPDDPGCTAAEGGDDDPDEDSPTLPCDDGADNDADGFADYPDDPGCAVPTGLTDTSELGTAACDNAADDDGDGVTDMLDPGCTFPSDTGEQCYGVAGCPACDDAVDNDDDGGYIDSADPGCDEPLDDDEQNVDCGATSPPACSVCGEGAGNFCDRSECNVCSVLSGAQDCFFDQTNILTGSGNCNACGAGTVCASYGDDSFTCGDDPCGLADTCAFISGACCTDNDQNNICD